MNEWSILQYKVKKLNYDIFCVCVGMHVCVCVCVCVYSEQFVPNIVASSLNVSQHKIFHNLTFSFSDPEIIPDFPHLNVEFQCSKRNLK
jgi:hypothetical protein